MRTFDYAVQGIANCHYQWNLSSCFNQERKGRKKQNEGNKYENEGITYLGRKVWKGGLALN